MFSYDGMTKERRPIGSKWSELPTELLELIMKKLAPVDILRLEAICSRWYHAAKSYISSPYFTLDMPQTPWLMLPGGEENHVHTRRFFNLAEFKYYTIQNAFGDIPDAWCVGSSHGWLVLMEEKGTAPLLLNPFSGDRIELPSIGSTVPLAMSRDNVVKVVTSSKPSPSGEDFVVVVILYFSIIRLTLLAYYRHGHDEGWTKISQKSLVVTDAYQDGMFHSTNGNFYALATDGSVEAWDLRQRFPIKTLHLQPLAHQVDIDPKLFIPLMGCMIYLVESSGELLLVRRFIRMTLSYGKDHPKHRRISPPYRTMHFSIYRLKSISKGFEWDTVESLHNRALFLGRNHSFSLSCHNFPDCEENSIYFTDDQWWEINKFYKFYTGKNGVGYGGHDLGVYNVKDDIVKPMPCYMRFDRWSINPPPIWIVPDLI